MSEKEQKAYDAMMDLIIKNPTDRGCVETLNYFLSAVATRVHLDSNHNCGLRHV